MSEMLFSNFNKQVNQDQLRREIGQALDIPWPYVDVTADSLSVVGMVDEDHRNQIEQVLDAHQPLPPEVPPLALVPVLSAQIDELLVVLEGRKVITPADSRKVRDKTP